MKVENTGSISVHMNDNPMTRKQVLQPEAPYKVSISTAQEINEAIKLDKPPYFPIGDTQGIFKK